MATRRKFGKRLARVVLPVLLILLVIAVVALGSIVYSIARPPRHASLVTPQTFALISARALKVTDETWRNRDGSTARGWLLRGVEGSPAIILLHRYGGDRSYVLNLGMKLNEATGYTVLWPDLRGHGLEPPIKWSSLGGREGDDLLGAVDFLRTIKNENRQVVGERIGVYGVELGAYAAIRAAAADPSIKVLALDSVPRDQAELIDDAVRRQVGVRSRSVVVPARFAARVYFMGSYSNKNACELARGLNSTKVLLLAGSDNPSLRDSTKSLLPCFPNHANVANRTDLPLSGYSLPSGTGEEGESYDRPVIDFFVENLH